MSDSQDKWDRIYARGSHNAKVAAILSRHTDLVQTSGLALDIACGQGTNALALAALGMEVDAWDISAVAIEQLKDAAHRQRLAVNARIVDITPDVFPDNHYDLILNCHYLDRSLTTAITSALKPGGLVMFQTFTANKLADIGPSRQDYLLQPDELLSMFKDFETESYCDESQNVDRNDPLCGRAYLVARKPTGT